MSNEDEPADPASGPTPPPGDALETDAFTLSRPRVQMAFACESVSQDVAQRFSFVNIVDALNAPMFPTVTPQLFIVFGFIGQLASFIVKPRVAIEDDKGIKVAEIALKDIPITTDAPIARVVLGLQGIQWPHPGTYLAKFYSGPNVLGSFPIVLQTAQPAGFTGGFGAAKS